MRPLRNTFRRSLQVASENRDSLGMANALHNLAGMYTVLNELDSALSLITEVTDLNLKLGDIRGLAYAYHRKGEIHLLLNNLYQARNDILKSLDFSRIYGEFQIRMACLEKLADLYAEMGDHHLALAYSDSLLSYEDRDLEQLGTLRAYLVRAKIFRKKGSWQQAYRALQTAYSIQDSSYNQEIANTIQNLDARYQVKEREATIKNLEENRDLKNAALSRSRKITKILLGGLVLLLLTIILLVRIYQLRLYARKLVLEKEQQQVKHLKQEREIQVMNSMIDGQEAERARIAQDLHDGLGGLMATIKSHFQNIQNEVDQLHAINIYEKTGDLINEASEEVRRISHNMMPASLQLMGLAGAVEDLAQNLTRQGQPTTVEILGNKSRFDSSREIMLFRIVQELAHNVVKHARSGNLLIQLMQSETDINILIEDDGIGFDVAKATSGLGLRSIRSRVDFLNGKLDVFSKMGEGSSVHIQAPLSNASE